MLGLVDYADSDEEEEQQQQQQQQQQGQQGQLLPADSGRGRTVKLGGPVPDMQAQAQQPAAGPRLPSAAELLGGPSTTGQSMQTPATTSVGTKRGSPDSARIGPLVNPLASQAKAQRSGGATSVASQRPPPGVLLPPQLRGRANVVTEDLSNLGFTRETQKRVQQQRAREQA